MNDMNEINITDLGLPGRKVRLLVIIASYGLKNIELLKQVIRGYQDMTMDVDVIVISDAPKELDPGVKVVVGLPSKNPWSLPFAHKSIFAENLDQYDLFAYSEDDMGVTEANIQAFLNATSNLEQNEIAGFLRYEVDEFGNWSLPDAHEHFHWKPESAKQHGDYTIAEFTNEHAAFYLLTQTQLKKAIASGGFLRPPYEGRYDLPCTAATDPYTSCGFHKIICLSRLDDFLIHHLSNRYAGEVGVPLSVFREQIETLMAIAKGNHPASNLCHAESRMLHCERSKSYYEHPSEELLTLVPDNAKRILSIGCGWGATEAKLKARGAAVTAMPMDSVIGEVAASLGIDTVYGTLSECFATLEGQTFDCVILTNLVHLLKSPRQMVEQCSHLVRQGGAFVISGPNFGSARVLAKRLLNVDGYRKLRNFDVSGIHALGPATLKEYLKNSGLNVATVRWLYGKSQNGIERKLGRFGAVNWVLQARR